MYSKYAASKGWRTGLIAANENSVGGYRSVSFEVLGAGSYGALKKESGVHRLVRMSPFNSAGKRQTSFSLVGQAMFGAHYQLLENFRANGEAGILYFRDKDEVQRHEGNGNRFAFALFVGVTFGF